MNTEIRSFYSLQDLRETVEEEITKYKAIVDEYNQWLGSFLRDLEATHGDEDWHKNLSALQKTQRKEGSKGGKKGESKKSASASEWTSYKELMLSASEQSEAEILFEAIEEIDIKIEKLGKVKNAIIDLEKLALGKDIVYVTYIHDGVPEKIVLHNKKGKELSEKFKFITDFSVLDETYP